MAFQLASGNSHDQYLALPTVESLDSFKFGRLNRPKRLLADKGYDGRDLRRALRAKRIRANIPERQFKKRRKRGRPPKYDKVLGKQRFVVERTNAWLKSFRRIHFRYDRSLVSFKAFVLLSCVVICLRRLVD